MAPAPARSASSTVLLGVGLKLTATFFFSLMLALGKAYSFYPVAQLVFFRSFFALVPLMIDPYAPGKEILHPVAITIFGGLVTATVLDTFLTPTLFLRYGRVPLERLVAQA